MYAVIKTGGKQYTVREGDVLKVETLGGEAGDPLELTEVLAVGEGEELKVGTPVLPDAKVVCEVLEQGKHKKVVVFKKKRRKGYSRKQGHRQRYTSIRIKEIQG
ncbi:MAG: 50S ribosomal protein L21 [Thermodesulfobacteriota bacterium]